MKRCLLLAAGLMLASVCFSQGNPSVLHLIYTSDAHYGLSRETFRNQKDVDAHLVNAAMIQSMNTLPGIVLPADSGVDAHQKIGYVDYLVESGDIANRMEVPVQSAARSWDQFEKDYLKGISLKRADGKPTSVLLLPGNHDISNAIGYLKLMKPLRDPTAMVNIYNRMMKPARKRTNKNYNYAKDKVNYAMTVQGIHFMFVNLWPDSLQRQWMETDLAAVPASMPVIIFTHDQPECEAKHFTNPVAPHQITKEAKFENLLAEVYKDSLSGKKGSTDREQQGWVAFLKAHPNIKAYFHGNSNYNQFYNYEGPDHTLALPVFRVDSPMKGAYSSKDETRLSYHFITIDTRKKIMTVWECLWNTTAAPGTIVWGEQKTIAL